jgi:hypothetical protein
VITDGDLRRALQSNDDIREVKAAGLMTVRPVTVSPDATLKEALRLMEDRPSQISVLPVMEGERCLGLVRKTILEISVDREIGRFGDRAAIGDHLGPAHCAVGAAEHVGEPEAGGGERLEAQRRQQLRGAGIPGIGDDEGAGPLVQRAERRRFLRLGAHVGSPSVSEIRTSGSLGLA